MRKIRFLFLIPVIFSFLACSEKPEEIQLATVNFCVDGIDENCSRSLFVPEEITESTITKYVFTAECTSETADVISETYSSVSDLPETLSLIPGKWSFKLCAYKMYEENEEILLSDSKNLELVPGSSEENKVSFDLKLSGNQFAAGAINAEIICPSDSFENVSVKLIDIISGNSTDVSVESAALDASRLVISKKISGLAAGYYQLNISFNGTMLDGNSGVIDSKNLIAKVVPGFTTAVNQEYTELNTTYSISYQNVETADFLNADYAKRYNSSMKVTLPAAADMNRANHVLKGWYETADFSGEPVTEIARGSKSNRTLYAKWVMDTDTLYVSATGDDSNTGLKNSPFKTMQKAIDTITELKQVCSYSSYKINVYRTISGAEALCSISSNDLNLTIQKDPDADYATLDGSGQTDDVSLITVSSEVDASTKASVTLIDLSVINHKTSGNGGLVNVSKAEFKAKDCIFNKGISTLNGGALYTQNSAECYFSGCVFGDKSIAAAATSTSYGNTAKNGGAIALSTASSVNLVNDCIIQGNYSSTSGGAVKVGGSNDLKISFFMDGGKILYNGAKENGGALIVYSSKSEYNSAGTSLNCLNDVNVYGNSAGVGGGAVQITSTQVFAFRNCSITENTSADTDSGLGGAIRSVGTVRLYDGNTIKDNKSGTKECNIFLLSNSNATYKIQRMEEITTGQVYVTLNYPPVPGTPAVFTRSSNVSVTGQQYHFVSDDSLYTVGVQGDELALFATGGSGTITDVLGNGITLSVPEEDKAITLGANSTVHLTANEQVYNWTADLTDVYGTVISSESGALSGTDYNVDIQIDAAYGPGKYYLNITFVYEDILYSDSIELTVTE